MLLEDNIDLPQSQDDFFSEELVPNDQGISTIWTELQQNGPLPHRVEAEHINGLQYSEPQQFGNSLDINFQGEKELIFLITQISDVYNDNQPAFNY